MIDQDNQAGLVRSRPNSLIRNTVVALTAALSTSSIGGAETNHLALEKEVSPSDDPGIDASASINVLESLSGDKRDEVLAQIQTRGEWLISPHVIDVRELEVENLTNYLYLEEQTDKLSSREQVGWNADPIDTPFGTRVVHPRLVVPELGSRDDIVFSLHTVDTQGQLIEFALHSPATGMYSVPALLQDQHFIIAAVQKLPSVAADEIERRAADALLQAQKQNLPVLPLPRVGEKYDFGVYSQDGKFFPSQNLEGKTVVVSLWATYCGPCKGTKQAAMEFLKGHPDDVALVFMNVDLPGREALVKEQMIPLQGHKNVYNLTATAGTPQGKLQWEAFGNPNGIPWGFVVDSDGTVLFKGHLTPEQIERISKLVGQL